MYTCIKCQRKEELRPAAREMHANIILGVVFSVLHMAKDSDNYQQDCTRRTKNRTQNINVCFDCIEPVEKIFGLLKNEDFKWGCKWMSLHTWADILFVVESCTFATELNNAQIANLIQMKHLQMCDMDYIRTFGIISFW